MKKVIALMLVLVSLLAVFGCSPTVDNPGGREYTYSKDGYGGAFVITLREDGTFVYVEGWMGTYTGVGTWTMENSIVTLTDDPLMGGQSLKNHFRFDGRNLVFVQKESTNFSYVSVLDGEVFVGQPITSGIK